MERLTAEFDLEEQEFAETDRLSRGHTEEMKHRRNPDRDDDRGGEQ